MPKKESRASIIVISSSSEVVARARVHDVRIVGQVAHHGRRSQATSWREVLAIKGADLVPALAGAFHGYEESVLLVHGQVPDGVREAASVVDDATPSALSGHLHRLTEEGKIVDLFLLVDGSPGSFSVGEEECGEPWFSSLGKCSLRAVWQGSSFGSLLMERWIDAGAVVVAAPRGRDFYPGRIFQFLRGWKLSGASFRSSASMPASEAERKAVERRLFLDLSHRFVSSMIIEILRNGDRAAEVMPSLYGMNSWDSSKTLAENLSFSSEMMISGRGSIKG